MPDLTEILRFFCIIVTFLRKLVSVNRRSINIVVLVAAVLSTCLLIRVHLKSKEIKTEGNLRLSAAAAVINPWGRNIIFIATKPLNPKQTCAVESAARANPFRRIYVLFSTHIDDSLELDVLRAYDNVIFAQIKPQKLVKNTVKTLYTMVRTNEKIRSNAEVLKILAMFKYGGIYLDLNVMTVQSYDGLADTFVTRYGTNMLAFGAMGITVSFVGEKFLKNITRQLIWKIRNDYENGDITESIGEEILTAGFGKFCITSYLPEISKDECPGLQVYDNEKFAMSPGDVEKYFEGGRREFVQIYHKDVRAVSIKEVDSIAKTLELNFPSMALKYCPVMFKNSKPEDGFEFSKGSSK